MKLEQEYTQTDMKRRSNITLQYIVAYFSLAGFTVFTMATMWMSYHILINDLRINEFVIMTVSNGNGIFTGLIFTLKDFLFGGAIDKQK